jgi:hypothetical protein
MAQIAGKVIFSPTRIFCLRSRRFSAGTLAIRQERYFLYFSTYRYSVCFSASDPSSSVHPAALTNKLWLWCSCNSFSFTFKLLLIIGLRMSFQTIRERRDLMYTLEPQAAAEEPRKRSRLWRAPFGRWGLRSCNPGEPPHDLGPPGCVFHGSDGSDSRPILRLSSWRSTFWCSSYASQRKRVGFCR